MTLEEALADLGVVDEVLTSAEKERLDVDGFLLFEGLLSPDQVDALNEASEAVYQREGTGGSSAPESPYIQNKHPGFDLCLTHPRILAGICHVLGRNIKSFGVHGRSHPPGCEQQGLHVDYNGPTATPGNYSTCNSIWMLSDFTAANGATRVIPGTHLSGKVPKDELDEPAADHPRQKLLLGRAGTVGVFNSHVWHGTTANSDTTGRNSLTSFFCRRDDPHMVFSSALSAEARERLSESARVLFADPEPWIDPASSDPTDRDNGKTTTNQEEEG